MNFHHIVFFKKILTAKKIFLILNKNYSKNFKDKKN